MTVPDPQIVLFQNAYNDYQKLMTKHVNYKISNALNSEDLVQETYLKTWTFISKGGKVDNMKAFLYHILNNLIIDQYRKRKDDSLDFLLEKGVEIGFDDRERDMDKFDGASAFILIDSLLSPYKEIMKMKYIQDLSLEEISLITGKSKNTLAVQIHRGIEKMKVLYDSKL